MKIGRQFAEERMYSEYEEERLYSTGSYELDELLERAFCEGYEYAQREFAEEDEKKKKRITINAAGAPTGAVVTAGGAWGAKKLGKKILTGRAEKARTAANWSGNVTEKKAAELMNKAEKAEELTKSAKNLYNKAVEISEMPFKKNAERLAKKAEKARVAAEFGKGNMENPEKAIKAAEKAAKKAETALKNAKAGGKAVRLAAAAVPGAIAGHAIVKRAAKKKREKSND
jgi:hypothetical protein